MLPLNILTVYTVPDCRKPQYSNWSVSTAVLQTCMRCLMRSRSGECNQYLINRSMFRMESKILKVGHNFYCGWPYVHNIIRTI